MSDLVKEAAPSLSPAADSSNQAINKRKLLALSSRGTASGGIDGAQASLVVDAFAEVFASMAIASPQPIENVESVSEAPQASDDPIESSNRSDDAGEDDSQSGSDVENGIQSKDSAVNELAIQAPVVNAEAENSEKIDQELSADGKESEQNALDIEAVDESTEASQLAVAATIAKSSTDAEVVDEAVLAPTTDNEKTESKPVVSQANGDAAKVASQQNDNGQATQSESADGGDLQAGEQTGESSDGNGGQQSESNNRRRYSKDDASANERPVTAAAEKSAANAKTAASAVNQQSESVSQTSAAAALPVGDRPTTPPVTAAAGSTASAAVAAASSASNVSSSALNSAVRGANGTAGISSTSATADGSRLMPGSDPSGRPEWAPQSKSSTKADAGTNQAETLNRIKLVQRVSRAFQHLGPDGGVVRLRLAPVELGTVRVEMQIQQKKVNARVVAETEAASSALREHLPELRARLEAHGMQIESLEVDTQSSDSDSSALGQRSQKDSNDQRHANGERQPRSEQRTRNEQSRTPAAPVSQQPVSLASAGGVDIRF
ncbi:flagellar hook-length control protein [Rubripirellula obstinata]|uniref:Flagellar hook-length control protein n=1 Tax=Rubripirellula obstinata TaxID=406547 RepID=A0A5B1CIZ0_9BACT|nr:flagellar hook-length control protein FliK [Rubripirellula obstinata]KAA1260221.1 flagellar hook-length control protein [Rubripirellula obstinata]